MDAGDIVLFIVAFVFLGPIVFTIFIALHNEYDDHSRNVKYENEARQRAQKAKKTREKNIELAKNEYPALITELSNNLKAINESQAKPSKEFYKKIEKICRFCSLLKIADIPDKEILKDILIYSRLNVLSFYEDNSLEGGEKLAKKIITLIKKLK